jgi:hypothetical protein
MYTVDMPGSTRRNQETAPMTTYLHGTIKSDWAPHLGLCLTDDEDAAIACATIHGRGGVRVIEIEIDLSGLAVEDRTYEVRRDDGHYPGDTARDLARLAAEGVDVVTYDDETEDGTPMACVRIVSPAALAAVRVLCSRLGVAQ